MERSRNRGVYRYEATTLEGFIQQLAVGYISRGYVFYVTGFIPPEKDTRQIDAKLVERYGIAISKWARARRKHAGIASVQYLRFRQFFVILATPGRHRFFEDEAQNIRDLRRVPLVVSGYSISSRFGRPHVRIERGEYLRIKAYFTEVASRRSPERIKAELMALPFEPYAPVRSQVLVILRAINHARQGAGLPPIPNSAVRLKRHICRPFEPVGGHEDHLKTGNG